jgi:hypothetical protein
VAKNASRPPSFWLAKRCEQKTWLAESFWSAPLHSDCAREQNNPENLPPTIAIFRRMAVRDLSRNDD